MDAGAAAAAASSAFLTECVVTTAYPSPTVAMAPISWAVTRPANPIQADLTLLRFFGRGGDASAAGTGSTTGALEGMRGDEGVLWSVMAGVATGCGTRCAASVYALPALDDPVVAIP